MRVALFPNAQKVHSIEIAKNIAVFFRQKQVAVFAEAEIAESIGAASLADIPLTSIDFAVSLGGDGTILRLVHKYPDLHAPILAINLGSFGFMADIPIDDIYPSLENLLCGNYTVQHRMMLEGCIDKGCIDKGCIDKGCIDKACMDAGNERSHIAVNEIVIHRAQNPCLIDLAIYVDDQYLNTFSADGMIVATPSGSTAYSLAAGGPILTPDLQAFVLTPICPHTISNRPIVLFPKHEIRIEYISSHSPVDAIYDGFPYFQLAKGQAMRLRPSARTFPLINMLEHDFFSTLRTKLGWSGKLKN